jgi:hypothetical protein
MIYVFYLELQLALVGLQLTSCHACIVFLTDKVIAFTAWLADQIWGLSALRRDAVGEYEALRMVRRWAVSCDAATCYETQ